MTDISDMRSAALNQAIEMREIHRRLVRWLRDAADGNEQKLQTVAVIEAMFESQSDMIAWLIEKQFEEEDYMMKELTKIIDKTLK